MQPKKQNLRQQNIRQWLYKHLEEDVQKKLDSDFKADIAEEACNKPNMSLLNKAIIFLILLSILTFTLSTESTLYIGHEKLFDSLDYIFASLFLTEYIARIYAAGEDPRYQGFRGRLRFMLSFWAIIDLISFLPTFLTAGFSNSYVLRLLRLLRLARLFKLGRYSRALNTITKSMKEALPELIITISLALIFLFFSAVLLYMVEGETQPDAFGSIPRALWWAVATLTTVGYGDVFPITGWGRFAAALVALFGIALIAMPTGIIAAKFQQAIEKSRE